MHLPQRKFKAILRIEIEDLIAHVNALVERHRAREARGEETEHVCFENIAVLLNEECGFGDFLRLLDRTDPMAFPDLDALAADLAERFRARVRACGLAEAGYLFVERKIHRVKDYVAHGHAYDHMTLRAQADATAAP